MVTLLRFDGVQVEVKAARIVRVRPSSTIRNEEGSSLVDGLITPYYTSSPQEIAEAVRKEISSFTSLEQPDGTAVWFDGAKASGPVLVSKVNRLEQVRSALWIGNSVQYVRNTPDEVFQLLAAQGGNAEPPVRSPYDEKIETARTTGISYNRSDSRIIFPLWDADLYGIPTQ